MKKLIFENIGWNHYQAEKVRENLEIMIDGIDRMIDIETPIIVHLYRNNPKAAKEGLRAEYDAGIITLYDNSPDWRGDFLHEYAHQIFQEKNIRIGLFMFIKKIMINSGEIINQS